MNLDIKEVIMLEIPECVEVKIYEICNQASVEDVSSPISMG